MNISRLCALSVATVLSFPAMADQAAGEWQTLGFAQLTAEQVGSASGIDFGADRVRAGVKYTSSDWFGGLVLDFNVPDAGDKKVGQLNNIIKDAYVGWNFHPNYALKAGQFKTPVGMDFNTPGNALDITKRALEKPLVLERDAGIMLSARKLIDSIGFDLGVFSVASRSAATNYTPAQKGESNAFAARVLFDQPTLHAELSYGLSEDAGGPGSEDYSVIDAGISKTIDKLTLKAEWISGDKIRGVSGSKETAAYVHAGYRFCPQLEGIVRHYSADSELAATPDTDLTNTYIGVNWWPQSPSAIAVRLQANYVIAGGDKTAFTGLGGFRDDAVLVQLQLSKR